MNRKIGQVCHKQLCLGENRSSSLECEGSKNVI